MEFPFPGSVQSNKENEDENEDVEANLTFLIIKK